ncbi:MAG: sigma-54-dependent Fis family transcriptional regulator [Gemmatimonadetes bacterium]|jgi:transcriptional regulator with GAF, ATPase, and Fis domain|nr:sigma-54-dependent Fis family transcriptional regulator [Gemmatimonadota bacterium]
MTSQVERELEHRLFHLQTLYDVSREIVPLQDVQSILKVAAMTLAGVLGASTAVVLRCTENTAVPKVSFSLGLDSTLGSNLECDPSFAEEVCLVEVIDTAFGARLRQAQIQVWMGFQLEEDLAAGLGLGPRLAETTYSRDDLQFLETVRLMVHQALINAQLYEAQRMANAILERANQELEVQVQDRTEALSAACQALSSVDDSSQFISESPAMRQVCVQLEQVAPTELTALIQGETGTGKSVVARLLHQLSPRRDAPFVQVNCGSLPSNLVESELFGHEKGAFTGASSRRIGKVELVQQGTLFLDEIGDMPHEVQVKLLRLLEERAFERVGGNRVLSSQARVIAATNRDLERLVQESRFREDLYFRLRVFPVHLPPLRERGADIPLLARSAVEDFSRRLNRSVSQINPAVLDRLQEYAWPGNVRELEHLMQRAVLVCQSQRIELQDIDMAPRLHAGEPPPSGFISLAEQEKQHIRRALEATNWVVFGERGAARLLDINPQTLRYRIKKHGLVRPS